MAPRRDPRRRLVCALSTLLLLTTMLTRSTISPLALPPAAQAQIDNNSPAQPFASTVPCIRSGADLGQPSHAAPRFLTTCFGSRWSAGGYTTGGNPGGGDAYGSDTAVLSFGDGQPDIPPEPGHVAEATLLQVGAVYGVAYSTGTNPAAPAAVPGARSPRAFLSAFTKRLTRFGPLGPGGIYVLDRSTGTLGGYVTVPDVVPGPNGLPGDPGDGTRSDFPNTHPLYAPTYTPEMGGIHWPGEDDWRGSDFNPPKPFAMQDMVGRTGLGDLDLDPAGRYLYAVNLNTKRIYRFDTWSSSPQSTLTVLPPLPALSNPSSCGAANGPAALHPFGLAVTSAALYLGFICSAEGDQNRANLAAGVARYDLASGAWDSGPLALAFGLSSYDAQRGSWNGVALAWQPWAANGGTAPSIPQPILADIRFDEANAMVLGFRDRYGDLTSSGLVVGESAGQAFGDLLQAPWTGSGWGIPSPSVEVFDDISASVSPPHPESAWGALAYVPGTHSGAFGGEILSTAVDPLRLNSAGATWYNAVGGGSTAREEIYQTPAGSATFSKAAGLGDLELLCAWRAIGDRIWRDTNANGVQDAGEPDISGVRVQLFAASDTGFTTPLATVTTGSVSGMSGNWRFYVDPYQAYIVRIDPAMFGPGQPLNGLVVTSRDLGGNDATDSDADTRGTIAIPPGGNGDVNTTFDMGLIATSQANGTVGDRVWNDLNADGVQDAGEPGVSGVTVRLIDVGAGSFRTTVTSSSGLYQFAAVPPGDYQVEFVPPANALAAPRDAGGNDATDSDADASTGWHTPAFTISDANRTNLTLDLGLILSANVRITKAGPASVLPTQAFAYTLAWANDGPAIARNVVVQDTLPAGLTYLAASPPPASVSGSTLSWNLGDVAAGGSGTITINVRANADAPSTLVNNASISTTTTGDTPGDNTTSWTTNVLRPNVWVQKRGPATATVGEQFVYALSYGNNGNTYADAVTVEDTLPAGVTYVADSYGPSSVNGQTITWQLGALYPGEQGSILVTVRSDSALANGTVVVNGATISTPTPGDPPSDNTSTWSTTLQRADVYITKSSPNTFPVPSGTQVSYHLDYGNAGPAAAANVILTDQLPPQLIDVTWQCVSGCSASGSGSISLDLGTLAAGATGRIQVTGTALTALAREDFTNTGRIATSTPETDTSNNESAAPGAVWTADVQLIKLAQGQVLAGDTFTATLYYRNNGPAPATSVQLTDTLPGGISLVSAAPAVSSQNGQVLTWDLGTLPDAQEGTIGLVLRADASIPDGTIVVNQAAIATAAPDRDDGNNRSQAPTLVLARADLQVAKSGPGRVAAGDSAIFTLAYTNAGPSLAHGVVLTDTLPGELDYVSASPTPDSINGTTLAWNLGDLDPGAGGTITVEVRSRAAQPTATLMVTNSVTIAGTTTDPEPGNNTAAASATVETADVLIRKAAPPTILAGQPFTATLEYANAGPASAPAVVVRDVLPDGLTFVSANPAPDGPGLRWDLGDLAPGQTGRIDLLLVAPGDAISGTTSVNTALIETSASDRDLSNNTATAPSTVVAVADLALAKNGPTVPIRSGAVVTYTLSWRNLGPSVARQAQVVETLPPGFTLIRALPAPRATGNPTLTWELGDLAVGSSGVITLTGTLHTDGGTTARTNRAAIDSPTPDPAPGNNTSTTTTIVQQPDLVVAKTDGTAEVQPGDTLTYTITVTNSGPITATGVVLREVPPPGSRVVAPGWKEEGSGVWVLVVGDLAPGASARRTFGLVLPNPYPAGSVVNTVHARDDGSAGPDPTPGDNTATDIDQPIAGAVGDRVWIDQDGDGEQDAGEVGMPYVPVQLLDPATEAVLATATTDSRGFYRFAGLRLRSYAVRIAPAAIAADPLRGYTTTTNPQPGTTLSAAQREDMGLDIGVQPPPTTAIVLAYLRADRQAQGVLVRWGTIAERDTVAFQVVRGPTRDRAQAVPIATLASQGSRGGAYQALDAHAPDGPAYYWIVEIDRFGAQTAYGPAMAGARPQQGDAAIYVPLIVR